MLIAFKLKIALACVAGFAGPLAVAPLVSDFSPRNTAGTAASIVELVPATISYRVAGDFTYNGKPAEAPLKALQFAKPIAIMQHQVSAADYQLCVRDGGCDALDRNVVVAVDRPAVQVNWYDARAYAAWLSRKTGETYRLPTDEEWALAAGSKFRDDGLPVDDNDPSKRWIARYERESTADTESGTRAFGSFGTNENGLSDLDGNVWEWTSTCFVRHLIDDAGKTITETPNCGLRVAEGSHRAYITDFVRDARAGGCAAGVPPTNLGFRLVREERTWIGRLASALDRALSIASTTHRLRKITGSIG